MPPFAIALLLTSAFMHALWNLILKQSEVKYVAMNWQVILSGAAALIAICFLGLPPRAMWTFAIASTILEVLYFLLLMYAYTDHDFSLIYPIARGAAPALVIVWAALFLREIPTMLGLLGILLIVVGMVIIGSTTLLNNREGKPHLKGIFLALGVAFVISLYTIVDGTAVKAHPDSALPYALSMFAGVPLLTTPLMVRNFGWRAFAQVWRDQRWRLVLGGVLGVVAYTTALFAYSFAPLNYSEAIREVSVVIGAFFGWKFLNEKLGGYRLLGAAVIFAGISLIAIFG
ncbi:MAG: EamA family transporter [Chloroflexota bacterium]